MQSVTDHDVTTSDFDERVIQRSAVVPVVVDFWAEWCQPCRMLGPVLERLQAADGGTWELAKLNVDHEQSLARRYRVQSIPAVKGFRNGKVAAEFVGAQPEAAVRAFLERLQPSPADTLVAEAQAHDANPVEAERVLREALNVQPDHGKALLGLGLLLSRSGRLDEAVTILKQVLPASPEGPEARAQLARLVFLLEATRLDDSVSSRDPRAGSHWAAGVRAAVDEAYGPALEEFLWLVQHDRGYRDDAGRRAMLAIFELLGPEHSLSMQYRPALASALH